MKISFEGSVDEIVAECSSFVSRFGGTVNSVVSSPVATAPSGDSEKKGRGRPPKTPTDTMPAAPQPAVAPVAPPPADDFMGIGEAAPPPSPEEYKKKIQEAVNAKGVDAVKAVLAKYGVAKAGEIPNDKWNSFLSELA